MSTFESQTGKLAPQSALVQRYLILKVAGRGGMSAVYQALDRQADNRRVAIKEMSQQNMTDTERQEAMSRFQQEAHLLVTLKHPNLPRIYDAFGAGGRSFLVMDYIDGKTLLQLLHEAGGPLPVEQVLHYADQLCDVLTYLHGHNPPIIFRDLKPTNVMATADGRVYLIDFGIARFFKEGQPQDTVVLGSPGYAPPEQHGSGQTSQRSDLYSLGATLHCCLSNRDPYHATDRFTFAPVRHFNPQVPVELDELIQRLLSLDEHDRPVSALEVKQTLARIRQQMWQQSSARLTAVSPASATVYSSPSPLSTYQPTQPAFGRGATPEKLILRATPMPVTPQGGSITPLPGQPAAYPVLAPNPAGQRESEGTRVWTSGFLVVLCFFLLLSVGGSVLSFVLPHPYGVANSAGLDHLVETGLAVLDLALAVIMIMLTRSFLAVLIVLLTIVALVAAGVVFFQQTLLDIQPAAQLFAHLNLAQLTTILNDGLLALGVVPLLWLLRRPFTWSDRCWLFLLFGSVCTCAYLQSLYQDGSILKQLLLLATLGVFLLGILVAGQMERKRR